MSMFLGALNKKAARRTGAVAAVTAKAREHLGRAGMCRMYCSGRCNAGYKEMQMRAGREKENFGLWGDLPSAVIHVSKSPHYPDFISGSSYTDSLSGGFSGRVFPKGDSAWISGRNADRRVPQGGAGAAAPPGGRSACCRHGAEGAGGAERGTPARPQ